MRQGVDEGMRLLVARLEGEVQLLMATRGEDFRGMSTRMGDLELAIAQKMFEAAASDGLGKSPAVAAAPQFDDRRVVVGDDAERSKEVSPGLARLEAVVLALTRRQESFEARTDLVAHVQVTSRIARLETEVSAVMQRQSLDARLDRVADLPDVMPRLSRLADEVSAVTKRQESFEAGTDLAGHVQVAFREALESLSIRVDGISDIKGRLAERLANIQASTADLERNMRRWASRMDELAAVLADNVPRIYVGDGKEMDGAVAPVVGPLPDLKPAWACEQAIKLNEDVYDAGGAMRLDQFSSVSASVEHLNGDEGLCPEGFCVVASASCGQPVLLWRKDCRSIALARFGLEGQDSTIRDVSEPDVRQLDSGSWHCQAGIFKSMTCTMS